MEKYSVSEEEIREMENYLKGYEFHQKMMEMDEYEHAYFYGDRKKGEREGELSLAKLKQFEIRHFVMGMENSDEKLMLYYHYVKREPMGRCAELLGISRATVFRLKKRALALAVIHRKSKR